MLEIKLSADELVLKLLHLAQSESVCMLDSCGVGHLGSHLLIAGLRPVDVVEVVHNDAEKTLRELDEKLEQGFAAIFTLSYDFGNKLQTISSSARANPNTEPDLFLALFDLLVIHDYDSGRTFAVGNNTAASNIGELLQAQPPAAFDSPSNQTAHVISNFTKSEYINAVERIHEHIRSGDTYQTNLTQQLRCRLAPDSTAESIYWRLRSDHPAPFSAFLQRTGSTVISASPERFFRTTRGGRVEASPIKGTRPRGKSDEEDRLMRAELLSSAKDRAENTMIVDLVRNDLGRICDFGSVVVEKLCDLEEHPTLLHLVSTVRGRLRTGVTFSEMLRAMFPCGSITGAPKIRTMQIIDGIENVNRGLSMGAIGIHLPESWDIGDALSDTVFDLSVAIRTMVIRDGEAVFNVGGGVVIDSDPEKEFDESLLKARSLLNAIGSADLL